MLLDRRSWLWLSLPALVMTGGCEEPPVEGPDLWVYQISPGDVITVCDAPEGKDPEIKESYEEARPLGRPPSGTDSGENTCNLTPGLDQVRIVADYAVEFDAKATVPSSTITALADGVLLEGFELTATADQSDPVAVREFLVPAAKAGQVEFRVDAGDGFFSTSRVIDLEPPRLELSLAECADEGDCSLPAGLGVVHASVLLPPVPGATKYEIVQSFIDGGAPSESRVVPHDIVGGTEVPQTVEVAVPDRTGRTWRLTPRIGTFNGTGVDVDLRAAQRLALDIPEDGDCLSAAYDDSLPRAIRGEYKLSCRSHTLCVRATDLPPDRRIQLSTSHGTLNGSGEAITVIVDDNGIGEASLVLPATGASPSQINLKATASGVPTAAVTWELERLAAVAGELLDPPAKAFVTAEGSSVVQISGMLQAPGDALFSTPRRAKLVVTLDADPGDQPIACGLPLPQDNVRCDMESTLGPKGGCALSPTSVDIGADGHFGFELKAGACVVGPVTVELYDDEYAGGTPSGCLAEDAVTADSLLATTQVLYEEQL